MPQSWMVLVDGKAYGPYTLAQMHGFIAEGRIVAASLIAAPGGDVPARADLDPVLGQLFAPPGAGAGGARTSALEATPRDIAPASRFGRNSDTAEGEVSHFIILADIKSHSIHGLEEAIHNLGQAYLVMPQAWILTSEHGLNSVRNALVPKLGPLDMLFVADATHDKAAWYNFAPEADTRIRRVWKRPEAALRKTG